MDDRDDLLDRIQVLEQQLATVLERTGGGAPSRVPAPAVQASRGIEREKARPPRGGKRSPVAARRASDESRTIPSHPARIPGVRVACIGAHPDAVDGIRAYWEGRGATFLAYGSVETSRHSLDRLLGRADVVFLCVDRIDTETSMRLQIYCNQTEKAFVPLHDAEMSGIGAALESLCPLA